MFPGLGGANPKNLERMMRQFGIKTEQLNAKKVIFELPTKKLVIENPDVMVMTVQGKKTYTIIGDAKEENLSISEEDIEFVCKHANVSKQTAKEALEETNGDIAEAIAKLRKE